jgi:hypothetical protein
MVREKIATAPAEVKRDGFGIDDVLSQMGQRGARVKIAIVDTSRGNPTSGASGRFP